MIIEDGTYMEVRWTHDDHEVTGIILEVAPVPMVDTRYAIVWAVEERRLASVQLDGMIVVGRVRLQDTPTVLRTEPVRQITVRGAA